MARNRGVDLCRIVLMIFITMHHIIAFNYGLYTNPELIPYVERTVLILINSFLICAVNVFFLISGYFGIRMNEKKMLGIIIDAFCYHLVITLIGLILGRVSITGNMIRHIFVQSENYWFLLVYCMLCVISPYLNKIIESKSLKLTNLVLFEFLIGCHNLLFNNGNLGWVLGYSLCQAICMYLIGSQLKEISTESLMNRHPFLMYVIGSFTVAAMAVFLVSLKPDAKAIERVFSYSNPLIVFNSICFFLFFAKISLNTSIGEGIGKLSRHALAVYLILNGNWILKYLKERMPQVSFWGSLTLYLLLAIILSMLAMVIDSILKRILKKQLAVFANWIDMLVRRLLGKCRMIIQLIIGGGVMLLMLS